MTLKATVEASARELTRALEQFPWERREAYGDWLAQTYYYVRHTTRLLASAAARFRFDARENALHLRFAAHMGEEHRHEELLVGDLRAIGLALERFEERASTRMFYECQYYKIEHLAASAHFGYILPLESLGPTCGRFIIDRVAGAHGPGCVSFLRVHSDEDEAHLERALSAVAALPQIEQEIIETNVRQTTHGYCAMLDKSARAVSGERSFPVVFENSIERNLL